MLTAWSVGQHRRMLEAYLLLDGSRKRVNLELAVIAFWAAGSVSNMVN